MNNNFTIDPEVIWAMKNAGKTGCARLMSSVRRTTPGTPIETWRIVHVKRGELLKIVPNGFVLQGGRSNPKKPGKFDVEVDFLFRTKDDAALFFLSWPGGQTAEDLGKCMGHGTAKTRTTLALYKQQYGVITQEEQTEAGLRKTYFLPEYAVLDRP
jgi:hypothetical protein